jgi:thiamine biosynthesis lipoprotein
MSAPAFGGGDAVPDRLTKSLHCMGTLFEITVSAPGESAAAAAGPAMDRAFETVARLDTLLSTYKPYSDISAVNLYAGGEPVEVDPLALAVLDSSITYWRLTGGAFDPTVGPLLDLWGFRGGRPRVPGPDEISSALGLVSAATIELDSPAGTARLPAVGQKLDLGGIAKGYALDHAAKALLRAGIGNALLNFGGNLLFMGEAPGGAPWRAGVAHPRSPGLVVAAFPARDVAVSTSGDYENFFVAGGDRYSHIMDPRSGRPSSDICSATVIAPAGTGSDALSTAIVVLGLRPGMQLVESVPGVEAAVITLDDVEAPEPLRIYVSSGLVDRLEPAAGVRLLTIPPSGR